MKCKFELTERLEALIFRMAFVSGKTPNAYLCKILNEYFDEKDKNILNDKNKLEAKKINSLVTYMIEKKEFTKMDLRNSKIINKTMFKKFFSLNYKKICLELQNRGYELKFVGGSRNSQKYKLV